MLPKFLTEDYPTEKHLFLVPRFALTVIGFYPETEKTVWINMWAFANFAILTYGCYAEFHYGVHYLSIDLPLALDALCPVASSIMSLLKIYFIWWYRAEFKQLIQRVRFLADAQRSPEKEQYKRKLYTLATRLTALLLLCGLSTSTSYSIRSILTNVLRYMKGEDIIYETPFKMIFPEVLLRMPIYPVTFLLVHWHGYVTVASFVGADGFFLAFCLYFTTLLQSLREDLQCVLSDVSTLNGNIREYKEADICAKLTDIIARHNEIADLIQKLSSIMVEITLGHFITSSMIIGTSIVDILLLPGYGVVVYVVYTCAVLTEIFLYCVGGTAVIESSQELATAAYCTHWYTHSVKVQKMVLLLMIRAQRNMNVVVPFFAPSLPALTSILRFTGSLIALAKSIL